MNLEITFNRILTWVLIASPIMYWPEIKDVFVKKAAFFFSVILLLSCSLFFEKKRTFKNGAVALALLWAGFVYVLTGIRGDVFSGTAYFLFGVLCYKVIYEHIDIQTFDFGRILNIFILINLILMAFQGIGFDPIYNHWLPSGADGSFKDIVTESRPTGFLLKTTYSGFILSLAMCFCRFRYCVPLLFFIYQTHAMISLFVGVSVLAWRLSLIFFNANNKKEGKWALTLFGLAVISLVFFKHDLILQKLALRWDVWDKIIHACFSNIFLGYGIGTFSNPEVGQQLWGHTGARWETVHCQYLQAFFALGLPGMVIAWNYIKGILKRMNTPMGMAVATCLVSFLFQSYLNVSYMALMIITVFTLKEVENDS